MLHDHADGKILLHTRGILSVLGTRNWKQCDQNHEALIKEIADPTIHFILCFA